MKYSQLMYQIDCEVGTMTKELEIEFKNMLTEEEYEQLLSYFGLQRNEAKAQTNHYFDTPDGQLRKQRCALRIRQSEDGYECTLKTPAPEGNYEITDPLTKEQAEHMLNQNGFHADDVRKTLESLDVDPADLQPFGTLTTYRIETNYENGLLVLDHSKFHRTEDYEIEYEVSDAETGKQRFVQLLKEQEIPERPADKKIARLVKSLQKG